MSIGINVPNGVVNLPTVHMVQTFRGNFEVTKSFSSAALTADTYFGTFFFANNVGAGQNGQKVWNTNYPGAVGAYSRDAGDSAIPLFAFDFDGVQGAIKAKGDERWITWKGMYNTALTFVAKSGDAYGSNNALSAAEAALRNSRGTWRYQMNKEAGMANSIPVTIASGAGYDKSTITDKYASGGEAGADGVAKQIDHKSGQFNIGGYTKII